MNLRKSKDNVVFTGLLAGIAEYYGWDPTIVRIGFVILAYLAVFPMVPLYIIGAILVPEGNGSDPSSDQEVKKRKKKPQKKADSTKSKPQFDRKEITEEDWSDF